MNNDMLKKQFLEIKYNELNNTFNEYKVGDFFLKDLNEISYINKNIRSAKIASMLNDYKYQFSLAFITETLDVLSDDFSCKYISIILKKIWEQYTDNLQLRIKMSEILIDYKNGQIPEKDAYKQYTVLNNSILKSETKMTKAYIKFSELLKLNSDKQKVISLCENIFKILGMGEISHPREGIDLMMSCEVTKRAKEKQTELMTYIYGCDELKGPIIQVQENVKEIKIEFKRK